MAGPWGMSSECQRLLLDYFVASAQCFSTVKLLHVPHEAARYRSDHDPLLLHSAYKAPDKHSHTSCAAPDARIKYDVQKAEAYQASLATKLQQISFHSFNKSLCVV
ncbi:TPA: hypothetical protein ACH3X1_015746 [Trebouxia sp. C0004]